jgi:hypothetical protein
MKTERLWTIVLDFRGGTYISQVRSRGVSTVLEEWLSMITADELTQWNLKRSALSAAIADGALIPLMNRFNVWCLTGTDDEGELLLINVVMTAE